MPDLDHIRREIEYMRVQLGRQRKDILSLLSALAKCRDIAVREGWCYQHVQAIIVAVQYRAGKAECLFGAG